MPEVRDPIRFLVFLCAIALIACGDGSSKPAAQATDSASESDSSSTDDSSSSDRSESDSSSEVSEHIFDLSYQTGSAHLEMSGDKNESAELTNVGGYTINGATFATFANTDNTAALSLALGGDRPGGISVTINGVATAGEFGNGCEIDVKTNSNTEFAGTIECRDIDAVSGSDISKIDFKATFTAKAA